MENCTANFRRIARKNLRVLSRRERRKVSVNRATNVAIKIFRSNRSILVSNIRMSISKLCDLEPTRLIKWNMK